MNSVRSTRGVMIAAALTTAGAICFAQTLALMIYPVSSGSTADIFAPVITLFTAFPISLFIWSKLRENMVLTEQLQRLLERDRLTDAATRDHFFATMAEDPRAYGVSLMVDIDHFKQVNDSHGHLAGDIVIAEVARLLRDIVRAEDIVCRFGGEEFVIFLRDHDYGRGERVAERMRAAIAGHRITVNGTQLCVTVSIGGSLKQALDDLMQAIQQADEALYRAKRLGRNRIEFGPDIEAGLA